MQADVLKKQLYHNGSDEITGSNPRTFSDIWKIYSKMSDNFFVMYQNKNGKVRYAPLYIHTLRFIDNRHLTKSQIFLRDNPDPEKLETVSDKLKWYRINSGLLQRDVANVMEVDRTTYSRYEENVLEAYPIDKLLKAAELFGIDVTSLLDDYNLFLYNGQGKQIKGLRKSMKLTQSQFAIYIKTPLGTLKKWEQDKVNIQKKTFKKLFSFQNTLIDV